MPEGANLLKISTSEPRPNGRDHDPADRDDGNLASYWGVSPRRSPTPHAGKARRGKAELAGVREAYTLSKRTDI
jgi:hypothetical protein